MYWNLSKMSSFQQISYSQGMKHRFISSEIRKLFLQLHFGTEQRVFAMSSEQRSVSKQLSPIFLFKFQNENVTSEFATRIQLE